MSGPEDKGRGAASNELHNHNCFDYLQNLKPIPPVLLSLFEEPLRAQLLTICGKKDQKYNNKMAYADIYTQFFGALEANIDTFYKGIESNTALDEFITSIYHNDNQILEKTYEAIKDIPLEQTPASGGIQKAIAGLTKDNPRGPRMALSPNQAGSRTGRFSAMMAKDFYPQHGTSLPTVRHYESNKGEPLNIVLEHKDSGMMVRLALALYLNDF